jgi:hypothetical protein
MMEAATSAVRPECYQSAIALRRCGIRGRGSGAGGPARCHLGIVRQVPVDLQLVASAELFEAPGDEIQHASNSGRDSKSAGGAW